MSKYASAWQTYIAQQEGEHATNPVFAKIVSAVSQLPIAARKSSLSILDLGCGTGILLQALTAAGLKIERYIAVDANAELLGAAKSHASNVKSHFFQIDLSKTGNSSQATPQKWPIDIVFMVRILNNLPDRAAAELLIAVRHAYPNAILLVLNPYARVAPHSERAREREVLEILSSTIEHETFNGATVAHYQRSHQAYLSALRWLGYRHPSCELFSVDPNRDVSHMLLIANAH